MAAVLWRVSICFAMASVAASGVEHITNVPQTEIANRSIRARVYLPDTDHGYYRGSRFDWAGVIASLTFKGHEYFGPWFEDYSPRIHDCIMGPAEEFRGEDGALGFAAAPPGGIFIKIGVGLLRKPDASPYDFARPYQILSGGKRIIRPESDRVDFIQELSDGDGYSYVYSKTVRTVGNKPELLLEHALKNTGRKVIDTSVYNHGFYVIDGQPSGPEFRVVFPFPLQSRDDLKGIVQLHGPELTFTRQLQPHESVFATLTGFSDEVRDDDVRVENTKTGAGVRQTVDRPLSKLNFWSVRDTICPEPYIHMTIKPGEEFRWKIRYEFYTLGANKR